MSVSYQISKASADLPIPRTGTSPEQALLGYNTKWIEWDDEWTLVYWYGQPDPRNPVPTDRPFTVPLQELIVIRRVMK